MKRSRLIVLSLVVLSLVSCQLPPTTQSPPATVEPNIDPKGGSELFDAKGDPINVSLTLDSSGVTQVIPVEGGALSAAGADGTKYTLTIPAGALLVDTEISMVPVSAIGDLPFSGGLGGAVKLEPSGLAFDQFVTLKIEPAKPISLENQVLFGFDGDGKDLHLASPSANSQAIEILLLHFSGAGVASATSDEKAAVYKRMADRVENRLTNEISKYFQDQRSGSEPDPAAVNAIFDEYYNSVVSSRIKAASSPSATCADAQNAMQTYTTWARQLSLLGGEGRVAQAPNLIIDFGPTVAKKCFEEEADRCVLKHEIAGMIPTLLSFERNGQLLGALNPSEPATENPGWAEARAYGSQLAEQCFRWDLKFSSAGNFTDGADGYDSTVSAKVPVRLEGGAANLLDIKIKGKSALINDSFIWKDTYDDCDVIMHRGGGEFVVMALAWEPELRTGPDGTPRFFVKDFSLQYFPGNTQEFIDLDCWDDQGKHYPLATVPAAPLWTGIYMMTHFKEMSTGEGSQPSQPMTLDEVMSGASPAMSSGGGFMMKQWKVMPATTMATKTWQGTSEFDMQVFEGGEFELIHTPQR